MGLRVLSLAEAEAADAELFRRLNLGYVRGEELGQGYT